MFHKKKRLPRVCPFPRVFILIFMSKKNRKRRNKSNSAKVLRSYIDETGKVEINGVLFHLTLDKLAKDIHFAANLPTKQNEEILFAGFFSYKELINNDHIFTFLVSLFCDNWGRYCSVLDTLCLPEAVDIIKEMRKDIQEKLGGFDITSNETQEMLSKWKYRVVSAMKV